jgi:amidase
MSRATVTELWGLSAVELAGAIRSKEVSSREVVEAHLSRIEAVNPSVNAVTVLLDERALEAATRADRRVAAGDDLPAFLGVPFTVKGNIDVAGTPTTQGARALQDAYPAVDAPVVERMRAAGAIPIGRTNLPTYAMRWHTQSELWGATLNPWDRSRTPGASSGGEAAALATGMSPLGLGNDTLGSLRWPAQCCGVAALKASLGRIPHASALEPADLPIGPQLATVEGPMARRVADLRAALEVLAGPTWRDPWSVPAPLHGPVRGSPIRAALVLDPSGGDISPQVRDGVRKAGTALEAAGYAVEEIEPPGIDLAAKTLLDMLKPVDLGAEGFEIAFPAMPADTRRFLIAFVEAAGASDPTTAFLAFMIRASLARAWGGFQETHPLIVAPISTHPPFGADEDLEQVEETIRNLRVTLAVNLLGLPAVALPVGIDDGLPQAVQVIGPRFREDLCLGAASALEDRLGVLTPIDPR